VNEVNNSSLDWYIEGLAELDWVKALLRALPEVGQVLLEDLVELVAMLDEIGLQLSVAFCWTC
jgi:hypothetical protein